MWFTMTAISAFISDHQKKATYLSLSYAAYTSAPMPLESFLHRKRERQKTPSVMSHWNK